MEWMGLRRFRFCFEQSRNGTKSKICFHFQWQSIWDCQCWSSTLLWLGLHYNWCWSCEKEGPSRRTKLSTSNCEWRYCKPVCVIFVLCSWSKFCFNRLCQRFEKYQNHILFWGNGQALSCPWTHIAWHCPFERRPVPQDTRCCCLARWIFRSLKNCKSKLVTKNIFQLFRMSLSRGRIDNPSI